LSYILCNHKRKVASSVISKEKGRIFNIVQREKKRYKPHLITTTFPVTLVLTISAEDGRVGTSAQLPQAQLDQISLHLQFLLHLIPM
jgi:hypothetical protein